MYEGYGCFVIDGVGYHYDEGLHCGLEEKDHLEYHEPVTAYADSNLEDTWYAMER